jgi:CHAT domain
VADAQDAQSRLTDRRMALAQEWDNLVDEVRGIDEFRDFLRAPRLDDLLTAAADGPVVVVNISSLRCDALLVTADGVEVKALDHLSADTVKARAADYVRILSQVDGSAYKLYQAQRELSQDSGSRRAAHDRDLAIAAVGAADSDQRGSLDSLTRWLWDEITEPILSTLGLTHSPAPGRPLPRVWWCPTGPLTLLPLHAAGHHHADRGATPQSVLDVAVSSYTPTLRALMEARHSTPVEQAQQAGQVDDRLLIVAVPNAKGAPPLIAVERERLHLAELFEGQHTLLLGQDATCDRVQEELARHRWVHFSCHGTQNLADPSLGGVVLSDRTLTISEISSVPYQNEFAFLSACKTATGAAALPDEAITLAAAMHYTGYRHVIGTLWSVLDQAAADITEAVYTDLTSSGGFAPADSARALHRAVVHRRDVAQWPITWWSPFIHTGP